MALHVPHPGFRPSRLLDRSTRKPPANRLLELELELGPASRDMNFARIKLDASGKRPVNHILDVVDAGLGLYDEEVIQAHHAAQFLDRILCSVILILQEKNLVWKASRGVYAVDEHVIVDLLRADGLLDGL